jgi:hypothetical protein
MRKKGSVESVPQEDEDRHGKQGVQHALQTNVHLSAIILVRTMSDWPFVCVSNEKFRCQGTVRGNGDW